MAVPPAERAAAAELFADLGAVTGRAMMGGWLLYADGRLFGAIMEGRIHIRAGTALARRLEAEGAEQFVWTRPSDGRQMALGYWSLPDAALDDPEAACKWAQAALQAED